MLYKLKGVNFMSNVLFVNLPAEGHINPTIGLVRELIQRGEKVTYYCTETFRERLEATGATVRTYTDFLSDMPVKNASAEKTQMGKMFKSFIKNNMLLVDKIIAETKEESYDYIVYDQMCIAGGIIGEILDIPKIASCTTFAFETVLKMKFAETKHMPLESSGAFESVIEDLKRSYHIKLDHVKSILDLSYYPGDMTLIYTSRYYQPESETYNDTFKFVGPSLVARADQPDFPFEKLKGLPVIFISMGTVVNEQAAFYRLCFEALKDVNATVVLSVGKKVKIEDLHPVPENFIIRDYVPQVQLLEHVDVFFTHGGMNSSSEGLYFNTPLVVLPVSGDQPLVAKRVVELGAGLTLHLESVTADEIKDAANRLLSDVTYKQNATKIGDSFREAGDIKKQQMRFLSLNPL